MCWVLKRNFIYLFLTKKQNKYFWNMSCVSVKPNPEGNWHSISTVLSLRAKFKATCHCSRILWLTAAGAVLWKLFPWWQSRFLPSASPALAVIWTISEVTCRPVLSLHESWMKSHCAPKKTWNFIFSHLKNVHKYFVCGPPIVSQSIGGFEEAKTFARAVYFRTDYSVCTSKLPPLTTTTHTRIHSSVLS